MRDEPAGPDDRDGAHQDGDGDGTGSEPGGDDAATPGGSACDLQEVMARPENGCTLSSCHGAQFQGGLDLLSPGLAERLVGKRSETEACGGQLLADPTQLDESLLLRVIDPARFAANPCGVMMPLGSAEGASRDTIACFESFISGLEPGDEPDPQPTFEAAAPSSYVNKVKTLLTGKAATPSEIARVTNEPEALSALAETWVEMPEFARKLDDFLSVALQQRLQGAPNGRFMNLRGARLPMFRQNVAESFVRTAANIVAENRPFTEILTTRRWVVSTATLALLAYLDQTQQQLNAARHTIVRGAGPDSLADRVWHVPSMPDSCTPRSPVNGTLMFELMLGFANCAPNGNHRFTDTLLTDADFADFRTVELAKANAPAQVPPYYDIETLRGATRLSLMVPRLGFFTTPAFLANWETNEDNQFRVTTSQTLIVALGRIFSPADATVPLRLDGLASEHAEPGTTCFGCHQFLDPMRSYFARNFSFTYQRPGTPSTFTPSFAFRGTTHDGGTLEDFAQTLAGHPDFAIGWVQKLCYWANSQACNESDPEFQRIVQDFVASGFRFKAMVADLLSSPLVTGARETLTPPPAEPMVSITRRGHLCQLLDARLGVDDACGVAASLAGLMPEDDFSRGAAEPVQSAVTGLFHYAAAEKLCLRLATRLVGTAGSVRFPVSAPEAALDAFVGDLMGLGVGHPRAAAARASLGAHYESAKLDTNNLVALRSAFAVACMSPEVMAVGL